MRLDSIADVDAECEIQNIVTYLCFLWRLPDCTLLLQVCYGFLSSADLA